MTSRAPTYYHWARDKPCTTNQVYGYGLPTGDGVDGKTRKEKPGPFDYTRPFSASAFFPQISKSSDGLSSGGHGNKKTRHLGMRRPCPEYCPPGFKNKFDINKGYVMGPVPVTDRVRRSNLPIGVKLDRSISAPCGTYQYREPKGPEAFLWHTLAGTLVRVRNHRPDAQERAY